MIFWIFKNNYKRFIASNSYLKELFEDLDDLAKLDFLNNKFYDY